VTPQPGDDRTTETGPYPDHTDREHTTMNDPAADSELAPLYQRWIEESGYPTEADGLHLADRERFAAALQKDALPDLDLATFRKISNGSRYGAPGPQANLNRTLRDGDESTEQRLVELLDELLWGEDDPASRIDRCLDPDDLGLKGLGESVVMKLLAICHPDRFIPLFPMSGDNGKVAILRALGEPLPAATLTRGQRQVLANDQIRDRLDPFLPGDPWGQMQFAYWIRDRELDPELADLQSRLEDVAQNCCLPDTSFLRELVELLEDKRQIVLYGPPGTGKTFIARQLAAAIAPDETRRRFVQFHPSTSYEDFFEGYRPSTDASDNLSYKLTPGPFAQLADHALLDPHQHVLVIDELNRANIPKVFGELLFLLEYRDAETATLYRPEGFQLPKDLWVIATMNTADRSIASIDAALRRRFHFVPVFPDQGPMSGLLARYLQRHEADAEWADLVAMVNRELRDRLGSSDLLLGPSHFMKSRLDEATMARIWRYNVEPFVDDLFYGDDDAIALFHWPKVLARFREIAAEPVDAVVPDDDNDLALEGGVEV
jgi:5-methylcytosine-specific restriction protein B